MKLSFTTEIEGTDYGMNVSVEGDFTRVQTQKKGAPEGAP